ncbi:uncharacterized protein LOC34619919 [Cyclospora cayetanensis]|uniref:Uncharacterized protein LOC34619919 n=1 Tax=Cyclospora cayetanensis TaxID=88456 RepID=A0A6P6RRH7_9EIME|nr:uncharacterized protein LOC34619919 [Cyclospora cayetanensis]
MRASVLFAAAVSAECGIAFGGAHRIAHTGEDAAIYRLLGHPAIIPLSSLAAQIDLIESAAPCLLNAAGDEQDLLESVDLLKKRSARLKPIIRRPAKYGAAEEEHSRQLSESAAKVHESVSQAGDCSPYPDLNLSEELQAARRAASGNQILQCHVHRGSGHRVAERFIIHEFIPHSEKLFAISEGLKQLKGSDASKKAANPLDGLAAAWREVYDGVVAAGSALLEKIRRTKNGITQTEEEREREAIRLSALAKYTGQKVNARRVVDRLRSLEKEILEYGYRELPPTQRKINSNKQTRNSLAEGMQLAFEVETVLPHLQYLQSDLEATKNKLSLQEDAERLLRQVRARVSATLGLKAKQATDQQFNLMEPLLRFRQLTLLVEKEGKTGRFLREIDHIRATLRKIHREAERLHSLHRGSRDKKLHDPQVEAERCGGAMSLRACHDTNRRPSD